MDSYLKGFGFVTENSDECELGLFRVENMSNNSKLYKNNIRDEFGLVKLSSSFFFIKSTTKILRNSLSAFCIDLGSYVHAWFGVTL